MAEVNPLWLRIVVLGHLHVAGDLECYGYKVTRHIPVGEVSLTKGDIHGDSPQQV